MRLRQNQKGYVYFIRQGEEDIFKIGMTYKTPEKRLEQIQINSVYPLTIYGAIYTENPRKLEAQLHKQFVSFRAQGEWFTLSENEAKTVLDNHSETVRPNIIEIIQNGQRFWYVVDTNQLFADMHNIQNMGNLYVGSVMAATNRLVYFKDGIGVDYDLLVEDWPKLEESKKLLLKVIESSLISGKNGMYQDGEYVEL